MRLVNPLGHRAKRCPFWRTAGAGGLTEMRREAAIHRNLPERNKAPRGALPYQTLP